MPPPPWISPTLTSEGLVAEGRIDAEHYGFWIQDTSTIADYETVANVKFVGPEYGADDGSNQPRRILAVATTDEFNARWVRVLTSQKFPNLAAYESVACVRFSASESEITIGDSFNVSLAKGDYSLFVCAKNIHKEASEDEHQLADEKFKLLTVETYDLIFVPKEAPDFGILLPLK